METDPIDRPNVYDGLDHFSGAPAAGTPGEIGLTVGVNKPGELQESMDTGELGRIASEHPANAKGFRFRGPRQISMFVADHDRAIKVVATGAAVIGTAAAILIYEHKRNK